MTARRIPGVGFVPAPGRAPDRAPDIEITVTAPDLGVTVLVAEVGGVWGLLCQAAADCPAGDVVGYPGPGAATADAVAHLEWHASGCPEAVL